MSLRLIHWIRISLFSLLVVAGIGCILRYKILYSLPWVDQKHLLHAHSHFAFSGWITQALMAFMVAHLGKQNGTDMFPKYRRLLYANMITAYGMLISFGLQGYGFFSIAFSTFSIFTSWIFAITYWRDLNKIVNYLPSTPWLKVSLLFNALSAVGAFALAFMMIKNINHLDRYLSAVYFFLHFQYNGWFFFASMGLFIHLIGFLEISQQKLKLIFWLFSPACIPAYFLSALWMPIPLWLYWVVIGSAIAQLYGWFILVKLLNQKKELLVTSITIPTKWLLLFSGVALSIKLLLQLGSTLPSLSTLAFGFRPIVIGYLHLILLGVFTLFLLAILLLDQKLAQNRILISGIVIFTTGILLNEILLMTQGVTAIFNTITPFINEGLLFTAAVLFAGMLIVNFGLKKYS